MLGDLHFAARLLVKTPAFTLTAVLILAVGIAGNTATFSAVDVLLLQPLPFTDADRLVVLASHQRSTGARAGVSYPDYEDWTRDRRVFEAAAAVQLEQSFNISAVGEPLRVTGGRMTSTLLPLLGVTPLRGRPIGPDDERPGAAPVVLITDRFWDTLFQRSEDAIGRRIMLDGVPATIVGVLPPGFKLLYSGYAIWAPLQRDAAMTDRRHRALLGIARLPAGGTAAGGAAALSTIAARLAREHPDSNDGWRARVVPLRDFVLAGRGQTLVFLMTALALLLLVACANVASLQIARGSARRQEIATRLALGASRWQVVRLLLIEAGIVAAASGALALLIVSATRRILLASSPELRELTINLPVLAFAGAVTLLTTIAFGLVPAITTTRVDLAGAIKGALPGRRSTRRLQSALVIVELALSLVLLVPAGLLLRSFLALRQMDPGFRVENLLTFSIALPPAYRDPARQTAFLDEALAQLAALPGIRSAAAADSLPLDLPGAIGLRVRGVAASPSGAGSSDALVRAGIRSVTPEYFRTFDVGLRAGRPFTGADHATAPRVAIVNETLAAALAADKQVVGTVVEADGSGPLTIVGVSADVRSVGLRTPPQPEILVPFRQRPNRAMAIAVATAANPSQYIAAVRQSVRTLDPDLPLASVRPMSELVDEQTIALRIVATGLAALSLLALALGAAGLCGILTWLVTQRTQEIGIRAALGATRRDLVRLIMRDALVLGAWGVALGIPVAAVVARLAASMLWGVSATDAVVFVTVPATLLLATVAAGYGPARRAARLEPIAALRAH